MKRVPRLRRVSKQAIGEARFRHALRVCLIGTICAGLWLLGAIRGLPYDAPLSDPAWYQAERQQPASGWSNWHRPVENPIFTAEYGNNHDAILFYQPDLAYPYHLIISHEIEHAFLWRAKSFSWSSDAWELVDDQFLIAPQYEFDDGVFVDGTYYVYESGHVFTYRGPLEEASGKWAAAGVFPKGLADDVGVYYEDGLFHIFGESGDYPYGPDGTSLAHFTSPTGLGDWTLVDIKAVDANPDGRVRYGIGDATIARIGQEYWIFSDLESRGNPYMVVAWKSSDINSPFEYQGIAAAPRYDRQEHWDNYRVHDCDIQYIPELSRYVMACNMMDTDGVPGGEFPSLPSGHTHVIGFFYSNNVSFEP